MYDICLHESIDIVHMPELPNAHQAIVDSRKLVHYVLNDLHEEGKHKAFVFKATLGITALEADELKICILQEIRRNPAKLGKEDQYGQRYSVEFSWTRSGKTARILTSWIILIGEVNPRLTSCYIK